MIQFINYLLGLFSNFSYGGIIVLMTIESSFIPFPSELIIPPAGYLVHQGEFNIILVILSGVIGSIIGALINYYLATSLGRIVIYKLAETKLAKLCLISPKKIKHSEEYFIKYGKTSTLIGRLVPAVRQLISIPAGLAKMKLRDFIFYTAVGAFIWNTILALVGYWFGANKSLLNQKLHWLSWISLTIFAFLVIWIIASIKHKKSR